MRADITTGATFPDYELPDQTGARRRLSEIQGHDPMIVVLSRGHYCPKDRRQLRNLVELYPEIKVAYTKVVTISTDNLMETNEMRDALGAAWPFLSDPRRIVQKDLEIQEYTDPQHDPMIPVHPRPRAAAADLLYLQRLLVLGPSFQRGPASGPPRADPPQPSRLGHLGARSARAVGGRRA